MTTVLSGRPKLSSTAKDVGNGEFVTFFTYPTRAETFFQLTATLASGKTLEADGSGAGRRYDVLVQKDTILLPDE